MVKSLKLTRGGIRLPLIQEKPGGYTNAFLPSIALVSLSCCESGSESVYVSAGEYVKEGQLIAKCNITNMSFHSPVPGRVLGILDSPLPDGSFGRAVGIQMEGSFSILGRPYGKLQWKSLDSRTLKTMFSAYGVVNTSGKAYPVTEEINRSHPSVLIVRLFEKDPTYVMDSFILNNFINEVIEGSAVIAKAAGVKKIFFAFGEQAELPFIVDFISRVNSVVDSGITVDFSTVKEKYPVSNKRLLLGSLLSQKMIPYDSVPMVVDSSTVISAFNAVTYDRPVMERLIHVSGSGIMNPKMLKVRIGTKIGDLIDECGGFSGSPGRIIVNGLFSGVSVYDLDTPVSKDTESIIVVEKEDYREFAMSDCIHCGACISVCPVGINPVKIYSYICNNLLDEAVFEEGGNCISCSCCSSVCPSRIPLVKFFSKLKKTGGKND